MPQLPMLLNLESEFRVDSWLDSKNFWTEQKKTLYELWWKLLNGFTYTFVPRGFALRLLQVFVYPRRGSMLSFETDVLLMRQFLVNLNIGINIFLRGFTAKEYSLLSLRAALVKGILEEWSHFMFCLRFFTWKMVAQPISCSQDPAVLETVAKDPVTYGCHVLCHYF